MNDVREKTVYLNTDGKEFKTKEGAITSSKNLKIYKEMAKILSYSVFDASLMWFINNRERILVALADAERKIE